MQHALCDSCTRHLDAMCKNDENCLQPKKIKGPDNPTHMSISSNKHQTNVKIIWERPERERTRWNTDCVKGLCVCVCVTKLWVTILCVKELCVKEWCVTKLCVWVTVLRVKELFVCVTALFVAMLCVTDLCERDGYDNFVFERVVCESAVCERGVCDNMLRARERESQSQTQRVVCVPMLCV